MTYARVKRRLLAWERYARRYHTAGLGYSMHRAHGRVLARAFCARRKLSSGRSPWTLARRHAPVTQCGFSHAPAHDDGRPTTC